MAGRMLLGPGTNAAREITIEPEEMQLQLQRLYQQRQREEHGLFWDQ